MPDLRGQVAIVTGASRTGGIGAAIVRALGGGGADVFFTHWTGFDRLQGYDIGEGPEGLLSDLARSGVRGAAMALDLGEDGAAERLLAAVEAEMGAPTILVNNATHWEPVGFRDLTPDLLARHTAVNVHGTLLLTAAFARRRERAGGGGRIVSLVSGQDKSGETGNLAYGASKGAISAATRYLAQELGPLGITVNAVDPGPTDTGWMEEALAATLPSRFALGRLGRPEDAARLILFLVGPEGGWITGQILHSDGGFQ
jgi:3-oxoacyl-[acyl-carrier protein] reductase